MKLLLENWRKYLNEGLEDQLKAVKKNPNVLIAIQPYYDGFVIFYTTEEILKILGDKAHWAEGREMMKKKNLPAGTLELEKSAKTHRPAGMGGEPYGNCKGAYHIGSVNAKGWGPLLYDIAMEWTTMKGSGLIADRQSQTLEARVVWDYYMKNRLGEINPVQLDDLNNTRTPEEEDNCNQIVAGDNWQEPTNPLSKIYTKKPTTIKALGNQIRRLK